MILTEMCEEAPEERQDTYDYELLLIALRQLSLHLQQVSSIPQGELTMMLAISQLEKEKGYVLPSEIKKVMHLSRPAISRMIHNLEKKGYLVREVSTADHRFVRVGITRPGIERMEAALIKCAEILKKVKDRMGEEDMEHFLEYNRKFCRILSEENLV